MLQGKKRVPDLTFFRSDEDFDQIRVPQGSLFVELHATRNPKLKIFRESFIPVRRGVGNDMGRTVVERDTNGDPLPQTRKPVWRLSFADLRSAGTVSNDPFRKLHEQPDATLVSTYDPVTGVFAPGGFPVNRYAYFTKDAALPNWAGNTHKPNKFNTFVSSNK